LVDKNDRILGKAEKMAVHKQGKLHRCFSIFIFNSKDELLLQKRAASKYHSPGLWSNTCCSHPRPGKKLLAEARKRLKEEMGFTCPLKEQFSFVYRVELGDLIEYEVDHVLTGRFDGAPKPNKDEADDWQWRDVGTLKKDIKKYPEKYTYWFKKVLNKVILSRRCKAKKKTT